MSSSQPFGSLQPGDIFRQGQSLYQKLPPVQWNDPGIPFANAISLEHGSLAWTGDKVEIERIGYQELALQDGMIQPARLEDILDSQSKIRDGKEDQP